MRQRLPATSLLLRLLLPLAATALQGCWMLLDMEPLDSPCTGPARWREAATDDGGTVRWCQLESGVAHGPYAWTMGDGFSAQGFPTVKGARMTGRFRMGRAHGTWRQERPDGNPDWERYWHEGEPCGTWLFWDEMNPSAEPRWYPEFQYQACGEPSAPIPEDDPVAPTPDPSGWDGLTCPEDGQPRRLETDPADPLTRFCTVRQVRDGVAAYTRDGPAGRWRVWPTPAGARPLKASDGQYALGLRSGSWRYWDASGALSETGGYVDDLREGRWETWAPEGWLVSEGHWRAGIREGAWVDYHPHGLKQRAGAFVAGAEDGLWEVWDPTGQRLEAATWKAGLREGPYAAWHANGQPSLSGAYRAGRRDGVWQTFATNGQLLSEGTYAGGLETGTWRFWSVDGAPTEEGPYVAGERHGAWVIWQRRAGLRVTTRGTYRFGVAQGLWLSTWDDGTVESRQTYIDGLREGPSEGFWPNGQRLVEGTFLRDLPEFTWRYWHDNGQLLAEGSYLRGRPSGEWVYFTRDGAPATREEVGM